jgi:hypothetical protein
VYTLPLSHQGKYMQMRGLENETLSDTTVGIRKRQSKGVRKLRGMGCVGLVNGAEEPCPENFNRKAEKDDTWMIQI